LGQGRENAKQFLRDTPGLAVEIENKVREAKGLPIVMLMPDSARTPEKLDNST
jgi:recombination protein RecA